MKKITAIIMCIAMILTAIPMAVFAAEDRTVVKTGFCGAEGENLTWTLFDDGELVISGEGEMAFYFINQKTVELSSPLVPPWYDIIGEVKVITVEEGVTSIGHDAFHCNKREYYRVNLPKSLEYYYSGSFTSTHADKTTLACSYAGTRLDWGKVEKRTANHIRISSDFTEIIELECNYISHGSGISDIASDDMYYNGEEPKPYCKLFFKTSSEYKNRIENGGTAGVYVRYYSGEYTDAKLVWRTQGDACKTEYVKYSASGIPIEANITSVTHGEYSVIIELVNPDGTVICSDRMDFFSYVPEDMTFSEKAEEFFAKIIGMGAWYIYMLNLLAILLGMSFFG